MDQLTSIVWQALSKQDYNSYTKDIIYEMGLESLKDIIGELSKVKEFHTSPFIENQLGKLLWVTLSTFKALGVDPEHALKYANGEIKEEQLSIVELNNAFDVLSKEKNAYIGVDFGGKVIDDIVNNDYNFNLVFSGEDGCQIMYKEFTNVGYINFIANDEKNGILINEFHMDVNWDNDTNKINTMGLFIKAMKEKQKTENKVYNKIYLIKEYEAFGGTSDWSSLLGFKSTNERPTWSALYTDAFSVLEI